jgi:hypothetical protein
MAQVPTGTTFYVASAFGTVKTVTGISNAAEAVVTAAAHGFTAGDIIELTSGWGGLAGRSFKVKTPTTDSFVLDGEDTTNTQTYPAGSGGGSARKATTFTQITQVLTVSSSGGDPKNVTYKYLEGDSENTINDGFSGTSMTLELDADSNTTQGYATLKTLTQVQTATIFKMVTRNGGQVLRGATVALNEDVIVADGSINKVKVSVNGKGRVTRYAS